MDPAGSATTTLPLKSSPYEYAASLLAQRRLHQCIWLPQSQSRGETRVTFSTTTNFDQDLPTILFVGPMFGTRYLVTIFDRQAVLAGVRAIFVDRPGFGGSTPVPLTERMNLWLETVPVLLQYLGVEHVSLVTHSAGTTFTLNTLAKLRHVLHPEAPYVAFLAPWVSPAHSKMAVWSAASKIPSSLVSGLSGLNQFVAQKILPAAAWSGGSIASFAGLFQSNSESTDSQESEYREKFDVDTETGKEIEKLISKYTFEEGVSGGNDEARLCLGHASWGVCADYPSCAKSLAEAEARRLREEGGHSLTVRLHFAASDLLIGEGGKKYFEECWQQDGMSEGVDVKSKQWAETNHDSVLVDLKKGAMRSVFEEVKRLGERQGTSMQ